MATQIPIGGRKFFKAKFLDNAGNVTTVDTRAPAVVTVEPATLGHVENLAPDGLSGEYVQDNVGLGQIQLTGDADRGDGVRSLTIVGDVEGLPGDAFAGTVELSDSPIP